MLAYTKVKGMFLDDFWCVGALPLPCIRGRVCCTPKHRELFLEYFEFRQDSKARVCSTPKQKECFLSYFLFRQGATSEVYPERGGTPAYPSAVAVRQNRRNAFCRIFCLDKAQRARLPYARTEEIIC